MNIGLARHFQIPHAKATWMNGSAFEKWSEWYDETEVHARDIPKAGKTWSKCYCSNLPRAKFTSQWLFEGEIEFTPILREVPYTNFLPRPIPFPLFMWTSMSRLSWYINHPWQNENRSATEKRVREFVDSILLKHGNAEEILVVSHGFLMQYLQRELHRRGFTGKVPVRPTGGIIYKFEN